MVALFSILSVLLRVACIVFGIWIAIIFLQKIGPLLPSIKQEQLPQHNLNHTKEKTWSQHFRSFSKPVIGFGIAFLLFWSVQIGDMAYQAFIYEPEDKDEMTESTESEENKEISNASMTEADEETNSDNNEEERALLPHSTPYTEDHFYEDDYEEHMIDAWEQGYGGDDPKKEKYYNDAIDTAEYLFHDLFANNPPVAPTRDVYVRLYEAPEREDAYWASVNFYVYPYENAAMEYQHVQIVMGYDENDNLNELSAIGEHKYMSSPYLN